MAKDQTKDTGKGKTKTEKKKNYGVNMADFVSNDFTIIKKITTKAMVGVVKKADEGPLYAVVGIASGIKTGSGQYDDWAALVGQFKCIPLQGDHKGKRFASGICFLPDVVQDGIAAEVNVGDGNSVQFAYIISKINDDDVMIGYRYGAEFLVKPAENDPLKLLAERVAADG